MLVEGRRAALVCCVLATRGCRSCCAVCASESLYTKHLTQIKKLRGADEALLAISSNPPTAHRSTARRREINIAIVLGELRGDAGDTYKISYFKDLGHP